MTNRERASLIIGAHNVEFAERCILEVERALDEAEKRGIIQGINQHREATKEMIGSAVKDGQRDMRERAAKVMDRHSRRMPNGWADEIRALPIEGE